MRNLSRAAVAVAACLLVAPAVAADYWVVANAISSHSEQQCPACDGGKVNQFNWGGGLEARFSHDLAAQVGGYRNTYGHGTAYAIGIWQPITDGRMSAGGFIGAATGYKSDPDCQRNVCPVGGFLISFSEERYGFNVMVIPATSATQTTVFGLQLKLRVD